jgi:hypothetical protein
MASVNGPEFCVFYLLTENVEVWFTTGVREENIMERGGGEISRRDGNCPTLS